MRNLRRGTQLVTDVPGDGVNLKSNNEQQRVGDQSIAKADNGGPPSGVAGAVAGGDAVERENTDELASEGSENSSTKGATSGVEKGWEYQPPTVTQGEIVPTAVASLERANQLSRSNNTQQAITAKAETERKAHVVKVAQKTEQDRNLIRESTDATVLQRQTAAAGIRAEAKSREERRKVEQEAPRHKWGEDIKPSSTPVWKRGKCVTSENLTMTRQDFKAKFPPQWFVPPQQGKAVNKESCLAYCLNEKKTGKATHCFIYGLDCASYFDLGGKLLQASDKAGEGYCATL